MKIAYVLGEFPTLSETFIVREIVELIKRGNEVDICSLQPPKTSIIHGEIQEFNLLGRANYYRFRKVFQLGIGGFFGFVLNVLKLVARLPLPTKMCQLEERFKLAYFAALAKKEGCDLVHSHFVAPLAGDVSSVAGKPFSWTFHAPNQSPSRAQKKMLIQDVRRASRVVATAQRARSALLSLAEDIPSEKIRLIHTAIDVDKFSPPRREKDKTPLKLVMVSRLEKVKGAPYLIRSLPRLVGLGYNFTLTIVGDGPERPKIENLIKELSLGGLAILLGSLPNEEVVTLLGEADIFVLPCIVYKGYVDGIPVVIEEAMAMELPVVSTTVGGIPELVEHMKTGILVPPKNEVVLAEAIKGLFDDEDLRRKLGKNARQKIERDFNIKHTVEHLEVVFREAIGEFRGGRR